MREQWNFRALCCSQPHQLFCDILFFSLAFLQPSLKSSLLSSIFLWHEVVLSGLWSLRLFIFKEICKVTKDPFFCMLFFSSFLIPVILFFLLSLKLSCRFSPRHPVVPIPAVSYSTSPDYRMSCHPCIFSNLTIGFLLIGREENFTHMPNTYMSCC